MVKDVGHHSGSGKEFTCIATSLAAILGTTSHLGFVIVKEWALGEPKWLFKMQCTSLVHEKVVRLNHLHATAMPIRHVNLVYSGLDTTCTVMQLSYSYSA